MSSGIIKELQFFGLAMLRGALLLLLYDLIRILRRIMPHGIVVIALEDVLYWMGTALFIFQLIYRKNDGAVRGYALLAIAAGMYFYHQIVSNWLVMYLSRFLKWILGIFFRPLKIISGKVVQVLKISERFYKNKLKKRVKEFIMILFS
jgi:spore cortex biosynthesis protein YabQ